VRDRDDRLKRLFLDPTPEAQARLQAVIDERSSSRRSDVTSER
jgi:hypothetical protein